MWRWRGFQSTLERACSPALFAHVGFEKLDLDFSVGLGIDIGFEGRIAKIPNSVYIYIYVREGEISVGIKISNSEYINY